MAGLAEQSQKDFIEHVRRSFLVGDDVPVHLREGALNLQTQLNNALRLLSEDLYSKKSHFVLELVQNADDNSYAKGVTPELTLHVSADRLVLTNNEVGFNEDNISAICKVGASSKPKDKQHHIGEKGIGFKSVFSVSDAPEVHSNGYHFRFDRTDPKNLLGYVIPTWCEVAPEARPGTTTIVLPASPTYRFDASTLASLDARVLLFLHKLQQLTLIQGEGRCLYKRRDHRGVSHLTTSSTGPDDVVTEMHLRYVRVTKSVGMTGDFADEKRPGVETSDLVLAFPVESSGEARFEPSSYVYAFLPVHQVGFSFPFHADFILNSGREAVLNDRPWNVRLRDGIAEAFVAAVAQFRKTEPLGLSYLSYVPAESDVSDDFFGAVRQQIVDGLSAVESIPSASGDWRLPSELRIAGPGFRSLFPTELARQMFGFDYVDERVQGGPKLLRELGVEDAGYGAVLELFKSHQKWLAAQPLEWRARLYAYIADNLAWFVKVGLLAVPCLPTVDGKFVVPAQTTVFFPLGRGKKYNFEHELTIVDGDLYETAMVLSSSVEQLFQTLNVRPHDPYEMVVSHILPRHTAQSWKESKPEALVGHLRYVKDKLAAYIAAAPNRNVSQTQAMQKLADGMWVGTKLVSGEGRWTFSRIGLLYLGREYKPEFCLETLLSGEPGPDNYTSAKYLAEKPKDAEAEVASWREFFEALGVRQSPVVVQQTADWHCSRELILLIGADSAATRRQTLECMNRHWQSYASKLSYQLGNKRYETSFARQLREMEAPLIGRRGTAPLSATYYRTQEFKDILGDTPPYVDAFLDAPMRDACRVTHRLDARALIKRLRQLKQENGGTVRQVQLIYRELEKLWDTDEGFIKEAFEGDGLVQMKGAIKGWFSPSRVSWRSNGPFLDSLFPPIQGPFKDFQGFFIDRLGVPRDLPLAKRVQALTQLGSVANRNEREAEALAIYKHAEKVLRLNSGKRMHRPTWMDVVEQEEVFVDHHGSLVQTSGNLFANDAPEFAKLFMEKAELSFLAVPSIEVPRLSRLLEAADIALLSEAVHVDVDGSIDGSTNAALTERVRRLVPYIARILYAKQPAGFDDALENHRIACLWHMEIVEVPQLTLRVSLGDFEATTDADSALAEGSILYRSGATSLKDRIAAELSKYLVGTAEFRDTFVRLLLEDEEDVEEVLRVRGIGALPADLAAVVMQRDLLDEQESAEPALDSEEPEATPDEAESDDEAEANESSTEGAATIPSAATPTDASPAPPAAPQPPPPPAAAAPKPPAVAPPAPKMQPTPRPAVPPNVSPTPSTAQAPGATPADRLPPSTPASGPVRGRRPEGAPAPRPAAATPSDPSPGLPPADSPPFGWSRPWAAPTPPAAPGEPPAPPSPYFGEGTRRPGSSRPPKERKAQHGRSGRLLSYVEGPPDPNRPPLGGGEEQSGGRDAVGKAAVAYAMVTLTKRWASLTEMPHNNPGYDVLAITAAGQEEFIEVKGQGGAWTQEGVALTPKELLMAERMGERYWLCVVEFSQDEKRRQLSLVKNPFGLAQQFRYDVGWKAAAEKISGAPLVPDKGLYVDIAGVGLGRIISVRGKGKFFNIHVVLQDCKQGNYAFNPAKMKLSEEPLWQE